MTTYGKIKWEPWSGQDVPTTEDLYLIGLQITQEALSVARTDGDDYTKKQAEKANTMLENVYDHDDLVEVSTVMKLAWAEIINVELIDHYGLLLTQAQNDAGLFP